MTKKQMFVAHVALSLHHAIMAQWCVGEGSPEYLPAGALFTLAEAVRWGGENGVPELKELDEYMGKSLPGGAGAWEEFSVDRIEKMVGSRIDAICASYGLRVYRRGQAGQSVVVEVAGV